MRGHVAMGVVTSYDVPDVPALLGDFRERHPGVEITLSEANTDDLVTGDDAFFVATGITDGELMRGVRYRGDGVTTHSLVMRSRSGTVRSITAERRHADPEVSQ